MDIEMAECSGAGSDHYRVRTASSVQPAALSHRRSTAKPVGHLQGTQYPTTQNSFGLTFEMGCSSSWSQPGMCGYGLF